MSMRIPGKIVSGPHVGKTMIEAMRERREHEMRLADQSMRIEKARIDAEAADDAMRAEADRLHEQYRDKWVHWRVRYKDGHPIYETLPSNDEDEMAGKFAPINGPFSWLNRASRGVMGGK